MGRNRKTNVAKAGTVAGITIASASPLIAASSADAARRCGGSPEVCFDVHSMNGAGRAIDNVSVYTTNTAHGVYGVTVTMYLIGTNRIDPFKTATYDLPRATRDALGQLVVKRVAYCPSLAGGFLPNRSFPQPCHTWNAGYRLGAVFNVPFYGETRLVGEGSSIAIK